MFSRLFTGDTSLEVSKEHHAPRYVRGVGFNERSFLACCDGTVLQRVRSREIVLLFSSFRGEQHLIASDKQISPLLFTLAHLNGAHHWSDESWISHCDLR